MFFSIIMYEDILNCINKMSKLKNITAALELTKMEQNTDWVFNKRIMKLYMALRNKFKKLGCAAGIHANGKSRIFIEKQMKP